MHRRLPAILAPAAFCFAAAHFAAGLAPACPVPPVGTIAVRMPSPIVATNLRVIGALLSYGAADGAVNGETADRRSRGREETGDVPLGTLTARLDDCCHVAVRVEEERRFAGASRRR